MSYATIEEYLLWFGGTEVARTATPDDQPSITGELIRLTISDGDRADYSQEEQTAADLAVQRLQAALTDSSHQIDAYLVRRYPLPLNDTVIQTSPLPRLCGTLTRYLLHDDQADSEILERHTQAIRWLQALAEGTVLLPGSPGTTNLATGAGSPLYTAVNRLYDQETLRDYL